MDKEMFIQHLKKQLQERAGCEIRQQTVTKNNGVKRTAFIIMREDKNVHPSIYIDNFYDLFLNGETYENIINKIMKFEQKEGLNTNFNVNDFLDYEKIKGNLYYRIINYHKNSKQLKNMPHKKYLDLAKVYYVVGVAGKHVNRLNLIARNLKIKHLIAADFAHLNKSLTRNHNKEFPLCVVPVLAFCNAGL